MQSVWLVISAKLYKHVFFQEVFISGPRQASRIPSFSCQYMSIYRAQKAVHHERIRLPPFLQAISLLNSLFARRKAMNQR